MNMSNRLTFSILSIFLLLAFVAVPVMAHGPESDDTVGPHTHPVTEAVVADASADPPVLAVPVHGAHPTATITLKPDQENARDNMNMVAIVADDAATTDVAENTFRLLVTFNVDVTNDGAIAAITSALDNIAADDLVPGDFTVSAVDRNDTAITNAPTFTVNRIQNTAGDAVVAAGKKQFEIVVTINDADVPSGTTDANDETLTFRIRLNASDPDTANSGVFALQTSLVPTGEVTPVVVPGGGNVQSSVLTLTLVKELPKVIAADTTAPVLSYDTTPEDNTALTAGAQVQFVISSDDALGTGNNELLETDVQGTTNVASMIFYRIESGKYLLTVTPTDHTRPIVLTIPANSVMNTASTPMGNIETNLMFTPEDTVAPTVVITYAMGEGDDANKVVFTFDFSEPLAMGSFTLEDISESTGTVLEGLLKQDEDDETIYTILVTPSTVGPTILSLRVGSVSDKATPANMLAAPASREYIPPGAATITSPTDGNAGTVAAGDTITVTWNKDPGTVTAMMGTTAVTVSTVANMPTKRTVMAGTASGSISLTWTGGPGTSDDGSGMITYTIPPTELDPSGDNYSGVITIPPAISAGTHNTNGVGTYVVVVRDKDAAMGINGINFRSDVMVVEWPNMPDLERLFYTGNDGIILGGGGGGALILTESVTQTGDFQPGTVGISEIMWAIDANHLGHPETSKYAGSQWIELHNLNTTEAKVILSWKTGQDITSDVNITGNLANPKLDVVTNFFNDRPGAGRWEVPGSNGASVAGVNFVSMARTGTFSLNRRHENKTDKPFNSRYTRTSGSENSRDGRSSGHWAASTAAYKNLRTTRADGNDVLYSYIGTPGRVNTFSAESQPHIRATRRDVPASPVIINEVANRTDSRYEWIEFLNVTDSKVNLRNYLISIVTSNSSDAVLYQFPANDNAQIEAQGTLLLVASDPKGNPDHPLATGWNVDANAEDQVRGLAAMGIHASSKHGRYKVVTFGSNGLPNDGKFVLILRRPDNHEGHRSGANGGKGVAETGNADLDKVVDIAGWDDNLAKNSYPNAVSSTGIWPLYQMGGIGGFTNNTLARDTVHYRQYRTTNDGRAGAGGHENKNNVDRAAYRDAGYSGIGYKRQAADSAVHGGSPGFHGITRNSAHDNDGGPRVYISEIMLSQGSGRNANLPQWIELYNASDFAVNLAGGDGVGWRLVIENPNDPIRTINFRSKGNVKIINPKQTVLVVSAAARSIGSDVLPAGTVFPDTRVFNVYRELKGHFEMQNRTSPILNPKSFNIRLYDGGKKVNDVVTYTMSDEIGNLDGNARTSDVAKWDYPDGMTKEGYRSSLIRVFDAGGARTGLSIDASNVLPLGAKKMDDTVSLEDREIPEMYAWIHASQANFGGLFIRHTWYGNENDFGTPANRVAQTLPVELSHFRPTLEDGKVTIRWTTESELDNAGFNILRSDTRDGEFKQVNAEMIQGHGTTGERHTYKWVDQSAKPNVVYYYQIEDVSFAGERQTLQTTKLKGLISARGKATTTWGDIKEVQ